MDNIALLALAVAIAVGLSLLFVNRRRFARPLPELQNTLLRSEREIHRWRFGLDNWLFAVALVTFLATRLIGLERFPVYFFTDEAIGTVQAADLIMNGLRDSTGEFLPTYFQNDQSYSVSTSVYAQIIPYLLFGKSVIVTRATAVLIALSGAVAAALLLKDMRLRFWWAVVLVLALTPAWFLHSRTAFEHVWWVAFFAWLLYFYAQYRSGRPRRLFAALLAGALAFYSYNGGQLGVGVMAVALLLIDARYHWRMVREHPHLISAALLWALLLTLPYVRFQVQHAAEIAAHLRLLDSYLVRDLPLPDKISYFATEYVNGLQPAYWYTPDYPLDLIRHRMRGYGHLLWITLPFLLVGLAVSVKRIRQIGYRLIALTLLVAPLGGALAAVSIQRDLLMVLPAALLTTIGLEVILTPVIQRAAYPRVASVVCATLIIVNVGLTSDAVMNGPTWYDEYDLYGLQFGAREVFTAARDYLDEQPDAIVNLFPMDWFNGPGALLRFFIEADQPVVFYEFDDFLRRHFDVTERDVFVLDRAEYNQLRADPKFARVDVLRTISLPNGQPGFYFTRLSYSPQVDALIEEERRVRAAPVYEAITVQGETLLVSHTPFDLGSAAALFDGDDGTLARTAALNPAVITVTFAAPGTLSGLSIGANLKEAELRAQVFDSAGRVLADAAQTYRDLPPGPTLDLSFGRPITEAQVIGLTLTDLNPHSDDYVHVREIVRR
jgi:hypothetical protein